MIKPSSAKNPQKLRTHLNAQIRKSQLSNSISDPQISPTRMATFQSMKSRHIPYVDVLSWVFGNTNYDRDEPLFIDAQDETRSISHNEAKTSIRKLIAGFYAQGLRPGDSVCLHSYNNINYSLLYLAVVGSGGRFVGSNPAYTTYEISHLFKVAEVKFVIVEPELLQNITLAADEVEISRSRIFLFDSKPSGLERGFESWSSLLHHGDEDWITFDDEQKSKNTIAALLSTSGTTGLPKAAELSHYSLVAQSIMLYDSKDKPYEVKRLLCLPQFHAFAAPLSHLAPLREGHRSYIMRRYYAESYVTFLDQYQITETTLVNPILMDLLNLPEDRKRLLSSLRLAWIAGAPLEASLQNQLSEILHEDTMLCQVWGMTEVGWITTLHYPEKDNTGSVGRLLPNVEARLVDTKLEDVEGSGVWGEVLVRSPSVMNSYFKNPEATESTILNGWLRTGDIGYQKEGKWYIVDRAKELIKVRGWQVSPTEIEACLLTHPAVIDAAVIGVDFHDGKGELPRAYVVLDPAMADKVEDNEIQAHLNGRLAKYKSLAGGVRRLQAVPRSASGKMLKKILRERARLEISEGLKSQGVIISETMSMAESIEETREDIEGKSYDMKNLKLSEKFDM